MSNIQVSLSHINPQVPKNPKVVGLCKPWDFSEPADLYGSDSLEYLRKSLSPDKFDALPSAENVDDVDTGSEQSNESLFQNLSFSLYCPES